MSWKVFAAFLLAGVAFGQGREAPGRRTFVVDCDAGQSLSVALERVRHAPGSTILVSGTCEGPFVLDTDGVELSGGSPETTTLVVPHGGSAPTLEVRGASNVTIRDLTISGFEFNRSSSGLRLHRSPDANVVHSVFELNVAGVEFDGSPGGRIVECEVIDNLHGVVIKNRSSVNVEHSQIRRSYTQGLLVSTYSTVTISDSEVTGTNILGGALVRRVSELEVIDTHFAHNGSSHLFAGGRSRLTIRKGVTLGGGGDITDRAVHLVTESSLYFNYFVSLGTTFHGDFLLRGRSFAEIGAMEIDGSIEIEGFSRVLLADTVLTGTATCSYGGDLSCTSASTVVAGVDCPSVPAGCTPPSSVVEPEAASRPRGPSRSLSRVP